MRTLIAKLKIPASESQLSLALGLSVLVDERLFCGRFCGSQILSRSSVKRSATYGHCTADTSANTTQTI